MELLYALEKIRTPFLDTVFELITRLGDEAFFIAASLIVFWCLSKKCGYYMLSVGLTGLLINQFLKILCRVPRPWVQDPGFNIVETAREGAIGYSFPSGHTQNAFTVFGAPARFTKNKPLRLVLCLIIFLIVFSRMYLGMHTPLDVGASVIIGLVLVLVMYPIFEDMEEHPKRIYLLLSALILLSALNLLFVSFYSFPADLDEANYMTALKSAYMTLFCGLGLFLSYHIDLRHTKFPTDAVWWAQILKLAIGLGIALALKSWLKAPLLALFDGHMIAHGLRYFILILFAAVLWPMTFKFFSKLGR